MKKLIFTFALAIFGFALHAQIYVNGKDLTELSKGSYLEIDTKRIASQGFYYIEINYGQDEWAERNTDYLTDSEGTALNFKNIIGALNYFEENGWAYEDFIPSGGDISGGKYLLKRK